MRTQEQIVERIRRIERDDWLGIERGDLVVFLSFENAKPFLKDATVLADWHPLEQDRDKILADMKEYYSFAWDKANDCRGLSAGRSLNHFRSWVWLVDPEFSVTFDSLSEEYQHYGKAQLVALGEHFGWDWKKLDDGQWRNSEQAPGISAAEALGRAIH